MSWSLSYLISLYLSTSLIGPWKRRSLGLISLLLGYYIGSNITASVKEINIIDSAIFSFDYFWMILITLVVGLFIYLFSKNQISRKEGVLLLIIYIFYIYKSLF